MPKYLLTWISLVFFAAAIVARGTFFAPVSPETLVDAHRETYRVTEGISPSGLNIELVAEPPSVANGRKVMNQKRNLRAYLHSAFGSPTLYIESMKPNHVFHVTGPFILSEDSSLSWFGTTTLRVSGSDMNGNPKEFVIDTQALTLGALFSRTEHETP